MAIGELYIPCCRKCGASMGEMPLEEFEACCDGDGLPGLCFDCDIDSAATVPSLFWHWQEGEFFGLGDIVCSVSQNVLLDVTDLPIFRGVIDALWTEHGRDTVDRRQSRAHVSAHARGLSSYTYLNSSRHNRAVEHNGIERGVCPTCWDNSVLFGEAKESPCPECGGLGLIVTAVFLPPWILGLVGRDD